jgi:predicted SAM-dependent methyltransferase
MASLEHIPVSPLLVLKEWRRTLKVEGVCAVTVPDADYSVGWALCSTEDDHYHAFTLDTLRMYFVAAGFEVDRCERIDRQPVRPEPTLLCVGRKLASVTVRRDG